MKMIDDIIGKLNTDLIGVNVYQGWSQGDFPYVNVTFSETMDPSSVRGFVAINVAVYSNTGPDTTEASNIRDKVLQSIGQYDNISDDMGRFYTNYSGYTEVPEVEEVVHYEITINARVFRSELPANYGA